MAWVVPIAMAVGGAVAGNEKAKAANRMRKQDQELNALETQYSPWISPQYRNVNPGASRTGSIMGGAFAGGMQGMSMMGGMGGASTKGVGFDMNNAQTMDASNVASMGSQGAGGGMMGGAMGGSMYKQPRYLNTAQGRSIFTS